MKKLIVVDEESKFFYFINNKIKLSLAHKSLFALHLIITVLKLSNLIIIPFYQIRFHLINVVRVALAIQVSPQYLVVV